MSFKLTLACCEIKAHTHCFSFGCPADLNLDRALTLCGLAVQGHVGLCFLLSSSEDYVAAPGRDRVNTGTVLAVSAYTVLVLKGYRGMMGSQKLPQMHRRAQGLGARVELYRDSPVEEGCVEIQHWKKASWVCTGIPYWKKDCWVCSYRAAAGIL